jgi:hypothetical protein
MRWEEGINDRMSEEFIADRLVCEWGFESGLVAERLTSYGPEYVEALRNWRDDKEYRRTMNLWRDRRNAGLVPKPSGNIIQSSV